MFVEPLDDKSKYLIMLLSGPSATQDVVPVRDCVFDTLEGEAHRLIEVVGRILDAHCQAVELQGSPWSSDGSQWFAPFRQLNSVEGMAYI